MPVSLPFFCHGMYRPVNRLQIGARAVQLNVDLFALRQLQMMNPLPADAAVNSPLPSGEANS